MVLCFLRFRKLHRGLFTVNHFVVLLSNRTVAERSSKTYVPRCIRAEVFQTSVQDQVGGCISTEIPPLRGWLRTLSPCLPRTLINCPALFIQNTDHRSPITDHFFYGLASLSASPPSEVSRYWLCRFMPVSYIVFTTSSKLIRCRPSDMRA